jgi:hypothetical protein
MSSFQQRTDDLYRLKTRNLVYQNADGSYPAKGSIGYVTNTVGTIGWSDVTTDSSGNFDVPGTATFGINDAVTVDSLGDLNAKYNVNVNGILTASEVDTNGIVLYTVNGTTQSQIYDVSVNGVQTLTWSDNNQVEEPLSGWTARLAPSPHIFRNVDTTGLTGSLLVMAQDMNALMTILQQQQCFVTTIASSTSDLVTVFNTSESVKFVLTLQAFPYTESSFIVSQAGNIASGVTYPALVAAIQSAGAATPISVTYTPIDVATGTIDISATGYDIKYTDVSTNGTAQMFMNHLGFGSVLPDICSNGFLTSTVNDLSVTMPPTPIGIPSLISVTGNSALISIPTPPGSVAKVCVYWCISGSAFSIYPNAIVSTATTQYTITGLAAATSYTVALSYRSAYDEGSKGATLSLTTNIASLLRSMDPTSISKSLNITNNVNWVSTPSYGRNPQNYNKSFSKNVKFTVGTVFPAIYTGALSDLLSVEQIQGVTVEFYAGTSGVTDLRVSIGSENILEDLVLPSMTKYNDAAGVGGSVSINDPDMLARIFNAEGNGINKNITFSFFCSTGGIRNCEVTEFTIDYSA